MTSRGKKLLLVLVCLAGTALALVWYLKGIRGMWPHNPGIAGGDAVSYDQVFYARQAERDALGLEVPGLPRSRMPVYPWLLHFFYDAELSKESPNRQLDRYVTFNVVLSVLGLAAVFVIFWRFGPGLAFAIPVTLITAGRFFVYKAVLAQPEILFYVLYLAAFVLMMRALKGGSVWLAGGLGLLAGFMHLVKASAVPMFALFLVLAAAGAVREAWRRHGRARWTPLLPPLLFVCGFLAVAGGFMWRTHQYYGSPLYDPNSKHYFWAENPDEMGALQEVGLARDRPRLDSTNINHPYVQKFLPVWLPDESRRAELLQKVNADGAVMLEGEWDILPSGRKFFQRHTPGEAWERLKSGLAVVWHRNLNHPDNYFVYLLCFGGVAAVVFLIAAVRAPRDVGKALRENLRPILFAAGTIAGSLLLYAWWTVVSDRNRFFLTQFLPLMFCFCLIANFGFARLPFKFAVPAGWGRTVNISLRAMALAVLWCAMIDDMEKLDTGIKFLRQ